MGIIFDLVVEGGDSVALGAVLVAPLVALLAPFVMDSARDPCQYFVAWAEGLVDRSKEAEISPGRLGESRPAIEGRNEPAEASCKSDRSDRSANAAKKGTR